MTSIGLEILIIFGLILANGVFALSEIAVVSARKTKLQQLANEGDERAKAALDLANSPEHFLSTIQVGITLIGILAGAFGGATLAESFAIYLKQFSFFETYADQIALLLVVLVIAYFSLILGELVPKRLALNNPEGIARFVARPMNALSRIAYPGVRLLSGSTSFVLRALGMKLQAESPVTEEEIKVLMEQGTQAGTFAEAEQDMVERVFRLGDNRVSSLMTPRTEVVWLNLIETNEEVIRQIVESPHSFFPVCEESLDNVLGVVHVKDLLAANLKGNTLDVRAALRKPLFVVDSLPALKVLESFKKSGVHIALVIDEYGSTQGLVTLNDVLEAIVGDIPTAEEKTKEWIVQREDGSWLIDGMLTIDEVQDDIDTLELPSSEDRDYETLGGFMMNQLGNQSGSVPSTGQHFIWKSEWRFEVVDMDGNRVDKVLLSKVLQPKSDEDNENDEKEKK